MEINLSSITQDYDDGRGSGFNLASPIVQSILRGNGGRFDLPPNLSDEESDAYRQYVDDYYSKRVERGIPMYNSTITPISYDQTPIMSYDNPMVQQYQQPNPMMYGYNPYQPQQQVYYGYANNPYMQQQPQMSYNPYAQQPMMGNMVPATAPSSRYEPQMTSNGYNYQPPQPVYNYYASTVPGMVVNPYTLKAQQEAIIAAQEEEARKKLDVFKAMSRMCHTSLGDKDKFDDFEKAIDERWSYKAPRDFQKEIEENPFYKEILEYNKLARIVYDSYNPQPTAEDYRYSAIAEEFNRRVEEQRKEFPDDMSLCDYFANMHKLYFEAKRYQGRVAAQDGKKLYDSNKYKAMLQKESNDGLSSYFNSILRGKTPNPTSINLGDMTLDLPTKPGERSKLNITCPYTEYEHALDKFFEAIDKDCSPAAYIMGGGK